MNKQKGFTLIVAIFLLVVLSAAATIAISLSAFQTRQVAFSVQGTKAFYAAMGGLEWGVHQSLALSACPAASTTFTYSQGGLNGYSVTVTCTTTTHTEQGATFDVFRLTAVGSIGAFGDAYYSTRQLSVMITNAPL